MGVEAPAKPLGHRAYGHIPHLPGSRMGPADKHCHEGQARICTVKVRDRHDLIIVQEKLDGSACAVAKLANGDIVALGRAGYLAQTSPYEQHQLFASWVRENVERFIRLLGRGERVVGEWLAQAHGTRYDLRRSEPFVVFDIIAGHVRLPTLDVMSRVDHVGLSRVRMLYAGSGSLSVEDAMAALAAPGAADDPCGALDPIEGAVWRVERKGTVDFLAKYVRHDKVDGCYLPEVTGGAPIWNWRPTSHTTKGGECT